MPGLGYDLLPELFQTMDASVVASQREKSAELQRNYAEGKATQQLLDSGSQSSSARDVELGEISGARDGGGASKKTEFVAHLELYAPLREGCDMLESLTRDISKFQEESRDTLSWKEMKQIVSEVDGKVSKAQKVALSCKQRLDAIKKARAQFETQHAREKGLKKGTLSGSVRVEIRRNLYDFYLRRFFMAQKAYSGVSKNFRASVNNRVKRELYLYDSTMTEEKAEEVVESGRAYEYMMDKLTGEDEAAMRELERLKDQHSKIMQLEKSVFEMLTLFKEVAALVDIQQEVLDNISLHIESAAHYTGKAEVELLQAEKRQRKTRKRMICFVVLVGFVALILGLVLYQNSQ